MQRKRVLEYRVFTSPAWAIRTLAGIACAVLLPVCAQAAQATFRWDYAATGAAGFMLYCGPLGGRYTAIVDVGNTDTYTLAGLTAGETYECVVTAYDATRSQSDYSAPLWIYLASTGRCATGCDGDLNRDGYVNALDLGILKLDWGTSDRDTDLNGDSIVNAVDLSIFRALYK